MTKINLTGIGADIEVFLKDKTTDSIVSAEGYIQGSKYDPHFFDPDNMFFSTSLDNVLAEFTIPPAMTPDDFLSFIKKGVDYINNNIPNNLCTAAIPSARVDASFLLTENAQTFGCEPDFNAYTGSINPRPESDDFFLRSGGGHIHIGYENATLFDAQRYSCEDERSRIIKALDLFIGIPMTIMEPDNSRKLLYGKAGAFRPKPYGVEYRTPSNYYLSSEDIIKWVHSSATKAIDFLNEGNIIDTNLEIIIEGAINNNDKETAQQIINNFNLQLI